MTMDFFPLRVAHSAAATLVSRSLASFAPRTLPTLFNTATPEMPFSDPSSSFLIFNSHPTTQTFTSAMALEYAVACKHIRVGDLSLDGRLCH